MHALPFVFALAAAVLLAPALLRALSESGHVKLNYRDRLLPCPFGVLALAAGLLALIPLALLQRLGSGHVFEPQALPISVYAFGVLALGLVDDTLAREQPREPGGPPAHRGWRGHGAAAMRGELSTGVLKAAGSLGLALLAMSYLHLSDGRWLLAAAVLVLATNLFNLLDLRPGRSIKPFVLLGAGLVIGTGDARPLWSLGVFAGAALVAGLYDLRERALLGDS